MRSRDDNDGKHGADRGTCDAGAGTGTAGPRVDARDGTGGGVVADWDELGPEFLAYSAARNSDKYVVQTGNALDRWRTFLETERGVVNLADVRPADVAAFAPWRRKQEYRGQKVGVPACNRDLAALKALYAWSQKTERLDKNPCAPVTMASEFKNVTGIRTVSLEDFEKTLVFLTERWRNAAVGLLGTGMRWSSLARLKTQHLDAGRRVVRLAKPKGKVGLEMQVSERTFAALVAVCGEVYPDVSGFDHAVAKACERAKVAHWSAHVLRHTFACETLRAGASLRDLQAWMGHASIKTTERYLHYVRPSQPPAPV